MAMGSRTLMPSKFIRRFLGRPPTRVLRAIGLTCIAVGILFATMGWVWFGRAVILHWDPVTPGLVAFAVCLVLCAVAAGLGNVIWQTARIIEREVK
jgi:hypothetical protein